MKRVIVFFLGIIMLLMFGCNQQVDTQADIQAIENFMKDFDVAFAAGDSETLASFYTEDGRRGEPNKPALVGYDAIRAGFTRKFEKRALETADNVGGDSLEDIRVFGDWAVNRGIYYGKSTPKAGGEPIQAKGKWMQLLQRQPDGSWKIVYDMINSDLPQPEGTN